MYANRVYNPRNAMFISRNDGMFNNDLNHSRDTIINLNSLVYIGRQYYTNEMIDRINKVKALDSYG